MQEEMNQAAKTPLRDWKTPRQKTPSPFLIQGAMR
jgi:hypothetical protein